MRTISAADANRQFSKLLRDVRNGETVLVTSRGEPVAKIEPIRPASSTQDERGAAWAKLFDRLDRQPARNLGRFDRDELYD